MPPLQVLELAAHQAMDWSVYNEETKLMVNRTGCQVIQIILLKQISLNTEIDNIIFYFNSFLTSFVFKMSIPSLFVIP